MTNFEILKFNQELIQKIHKSGIRLKDAEYVELYTEYSLMVKDGNKISYIVSVLAEKYEISERTVYSLIKRFQTNCNSSSV